MIELEINIFLLIFWRHLYLFHRDWVFQNSELDFPFCFQHSSLFFLTNPDLLLQWLHQQLPLCL
jgi:hypothetical protein